MKDYFILQYLMTNRRLKEAGVNPVLGYLLGFVAFALISEYIFQKTEFAKFLVLLTCMSLLIRISEKNRTDFLLATFGDNQKRRIRVIENIVVSIPFIAILISNNAFFQSALLLALSIISAAFSFQNNLHISMPTPFSKNPFEFTVGFRKTFYIFPIAYTLTFIAIYVDNLNLGIFSLLLIFLTSLSYYTKPENEYYVWVHADSPKSFLLKKIRSATKNVFILTIPILLCLLIYYPFEFELILLLFLIMLLLLLTVILGKYSAYPGEMHLPEAVILALSIYFPPLLFAVVPFFYIKAINKLKLILNDKN